MQVSGVSGFLTTTIDKITIDKFSAWLRWLIQWKNSSDPVSLMTSQDREANQVIKLGCIAILILITVIGSCIISFKFLP